VLAAIQVSPEANAGGAIGKIRDGDLVAIDAVSGTLSVTSEDELQARVADSMDMSASHEGMGRELFSVFRRQVSSAETGASVLGMPNGAYSKGST
jgi:phosphogluconate dehydratase